VLTLHFMEDFGDKLVRQISYMLGESPHYTLVCRAVREHELVLLCSSPGQARPADAGAWARDFIAQLKDRFGVNPPRAGASSFFTDYRTIEVGYREALAVIRLKEKFPDELREVFAYTELGVYRHLPAIAERNRLEGYANVALERLRKYDRRHHNELVNTLAAYLAQDGNIKAVADTLHIHPNTLVYRLKRIEEVGGIDLTDMDQKVGLYLDLKAEKL
jgi:DNA-binding PucR family transcriptional regulator